MSLTRFTGSVVLTFATLAVAVAGCSSEQSPPAGVGNLDMEVTLATPPSGPNEQLDNVDVSLWCDGIDPVLGVARPPQSNPETFSINVSTSQGPEPYNPIGLLEKQGLPAGNCYLSFSAVSNSGNTVCTGDIVVQVATNQTTQSEVVLACIHEPRFGGIRTDGSFNQCAEYRQILVTPTTQSIGNLVDVVTEVYDPDGDDVQVSVQGVGACSNVQYSNGDTAASCETVSGCDTVVSTVECTDVGLCQIIVATSDDGFDSCTGLLPDGSNNDAARQTINVDCTVASGCGNGQLEPGEECDPPDGVFCDDNCQLIDPCDPDPCDQSDACSPEVCSADANNQAVCTPDPGSAAGNACSPPAGGTCDGQGNCVACTQNSDCEDNNECTDNVCDAGVCTFPNNDANQCTTGGFPGTCNAGVCEGLCAPDTCPDNGIECVTDVCDPADGSCNAQDDGMNTGCNLGGGPDTGVCDGAGACVECNIDSQCDSGEACVSNVCESTLVCEYVQNFESLDSSSPSALGADGWLVNGNVFQGDGTFKFFFGTFPAPNGGPGFSGIVTGQGGPPQGAQQLSVYNDYNCCQQTGEGHFNGTDRVEANVFQELRSFGSPITGSDIGTTLTFSFDAKRGNINDPADPECQAPNVCDTTARAFIQTLDPNAGFNRTNLVEIDTTNIGTDWIRYEITLDLTNPLLIGQILQVGFSSNAKSFEPSGIFYDNVEACFAGGGGGPVIELRPLPDIYLTGNAINYGPYRGTGPGTGEFPTDAQILEDLGLLQTAGYDLIRLFGADAVHERILQLAAASYPEMKFQQGLNLVGLPFGQAQDDCDSEINDSQVETAIRLANTYPSVVTVSVGNETSFFAGFMPLDCLEGYIAEVRNNVAQPTTADDDYTFYANLFGRAPDGVLRLIDFAAIHMYPIINYRQWDWRQLSVPEGPLRAEAMMNASFAKAQDNFQRVANYRYFDGTGSVTIGESRPIVISETGWKWRETNTAQEIEFYAGNPVNAKWYYDLMRSWERSPGGPPTILIFVAFDEAWKTTDDGWGFWDENRVPNYALCDTPAGSPCNNPVYQGAGFFFE